MKGSKLSAHRGLKNDYFEIEKWAARLFVRLYCHFGIVVLLNSEWGFVYS